MDIGQQVKNAKSGDREALLQLILNQKQEYYKLAYLYVRKQEDALDAMEDMIVILYENIRGLKKEEAFYSWSKTILVNCCKNLLRKRKKVLYMDNVEEATCEGGFQQKEEQLLVEQHLLQLNRKHEEVIRLRYYMGMDYQAIADIMKIPLGTVKSRIANGLKKLKDSLGGEFL